MNICQRLIFAVPLDGFLLIFIVQEFFDDARMAHVDFACARFAIYIFVFECSERNQIQMNSFTKITEDRHEFIDKESSRLWMEARIITFDIDRSTFWWLVALIIATNTLKQIVGQSFTVKFGTRIGLQCDPRQ